MSVPTDEQLVAAYRDGDTDAIEILVRRYLTPVFRFVRRYVNNTGDADDIVQDVFFNVWKSLSHFDETKKFSTWVFTIAKNTSLNWIKKKKPALFIEFETPDGENSIHDTIPDETPLPDELFEKKELRDLVHTALEGLNPKYRQTLLLYYEDQYTFQEIADILEESVHTVKSRHRRALEQLKEKLTP